MALSFKRWISTQHFVSFGCEGLRGQISTNMAHTTSGYTFKIKRARCFTSQMVVDATWLGLGKKILGWLGKDHSLV